MIKKKKQQLPRRWTEAAAVPVQVCVCREPLSRRCFDALNKTPNYGSIRRPRASKPPLSHSEMCVTAARPFSGGVRPVCGLLRTKGCFPSHATSAHGNVTCNCSLEAPLCPPVATRRSVELLPRRRGSARSAAGRRHGASGNSLGSLLFAQTMCANSAKTEDCVSNHLFV